MICTRSNFPTKEILDCSYCNLHQRSVMIFKTHLTNRFWAHKSYQNTLCSYRKKLWSHQVKVSTCHDNWACAKSWSDWMSRYIWLLISLWPSDAIWQQRSGSTLAQVMACCLTAPSHYLNQCWHIISKVQWHPSESNFTRDTSAISHWNYLENYLSIFFQISQGPMS